MIRQLLSADLPRANTLFETYPYKKSQQVFQKLDGARLLAFYQNGLRKGVEAGGAHWVVEDESGRIVTLAGLAGDTWHSGIYGLKMGKLQPWLNTLEPALGAPLLDEILAQAEGEGYQHLSVRLDGEDFQNLHLFESRGWRVVDVSLKLSRPLPVQHRFFPAEPAGGWRVDLATPDDASWIRTMGSTTHGGTHYLNDPALPPEKTRALFAGWLDRCIERLAYRIYVLRDAAGAGRGFVTYLRNQGFAQAVGRAPLILDFVLIDPALRGGGLGPWFIEETLLRENGNGFDYCELRTSAHNLPAVINYEKLGFRTCASDFALHKSFV